MKPTYLLAIFVCVAFGLLTSNVSFPQSKKQQQQQQQSPQKSYPPTASPRQLSPPPLPKSHQTSQRPAPRPSAPPPGYQPQVQPKPSSQPTSPAMPPSQPRGYNPTKPTTVSPTGYIGQSAPKQGYQGPAVVKPAPSSPPAAVKPTQPPQPVVKPAPVPVAKPPTTPPATNKAAPAGKSALPAGPSGKPTAGPEKARGATPSAPGGAGGQTSGKKTEPAQPPSAGIPAAAKPQPTTAKPATPKPTSPGSAGQPYQVVKVDGKDTVYIVKDGKKYPIAGAKDFEDLGLNWKNIQTIPVSQLNSYAQGGTINQSNVASYKQQLLGKKDPVQQIISSTAKPPQASPQPPVPTTPQPQPAPTGSPGQPYQLVKAANDPKIYLVKDRIKHHVESPKDIANLGLDLNKVQTISANDLNKYTKGDAINQSNVASYRQQISGQPQPLKQVASGPQQVKPLQVSPQAAPTASQSQQLVTATGQAGQKTSQLKSEIEDIQQKAVALVTGTPAPGSGTGVKTALAGPSSNVTTMPITPQISSAGSNSQSYQFVKADNDPKVYLVKDGIKHHIEGVKDVTDLGLDLNKVQTVPAAQLKNLVHERDPINQSNVANYKQQISGKQQTPLNFSPPVTTSLSGTKASGSEFNQAYQLVKSKDSPTVYILKDGKKYAIQSVEEFNKRGLDWNKIQTVADPFLNQLNEKQPKPYWCPKYVQEIT